MTQSIKPVRGEEFARTFTKDIDDFGDWTKLEPHFAQLESRGKALDSTEAIEQWLLDVSELGAAVDEEYSRRYIAMTCRTDDKEIERRYLDILENVIPHVQTWGDRINRVYLACALRDQLDSKRYEVYDRAIENSVAIFCKENVPLKTEDSKLGQQYQAVCAAMTVTYRGEEKTLPQMAPFMEETDRAVREEAWRLVAERRAADRDKLDDLFDEMIALRTRIAVNAGYENFRDYQHQSYGRFDYRPDDCIAFQDAVAETVVPLLRGIREERRADLGVETLRPWDLAVDSKGRAPLRPFATGAELEAGCLRIFEKIGGEFGAQFASMRELGLLDLESRKGKAPGGYQSSLEEIRYPFIFMNAAGTDRDVFTLLHEGGHAFHAFAARGEQLLAYRSAPIEFCEVASMTMEMFAFDYLDEFYSDADEANRSRRQHLEQMLSLFPWIAQIDAFQHWIYLNPEHSRAEREAQWLALDERFNPGMDWTGLEATRSAIWHRQLHLFEVPFYYIEYGIAQLGALQLWLRYRESPGEAVEGYRRGLALGGARPLPELFETAGAKFDFSAATVAPIMAAIQTELAATAS